MVVNAAIAVWGVRDIAHLNALFRIAFTSPDDTGVRYDVSRFLHAVVYKEEYRQVVAMVSSLKNTRLLCWFVTVPSLSPSPYRLRSVMMKREMSMEFALKFTSVILYLI